MSTSVGPSAPIYVGWVDKTIGIEGGYTNDPNDSGGETMWGITEVEARAYGYTGEMSQMPRSLAVLIYTTKYIMNTQMNQMALIDAPLAYRLYDLGVNMGPQQAGTFLQKALNALGASLVVDGNCFQMTRASLSSFISKRGEEGMEVLLGMVLGQAAAFYVNLALSSPKDETFEYGWQLNRAIGTSLKA